MRKPYIAGFIIVLTAGLAAILYLSNGRDDSACKSTVQTKANQSGKYRAQMTNKECGWGLGLSSNPVEVRVEKLGKEGWFYTIPLEFDGFNTDQGNAPPTFEWEGEATLHIRILSSDTSGTLVRHNGELTVIRSYLAKAAP